LFIGVTGNSGTGQTTVARVFSAMGAGVCSLDETGHRLLEREVVRYALAKRLYKPELKSMPGSGVRRELSRTAFSSPGTMDAVEEVLHPLMKRWAVLSRSRLEDIEGVWVLEGALIFEMGLEGLFDRVILVRDTMERSAHRLSARDGIGNEVVTARWARQWTLDRKAGLADCVLENSASLDELNEKARRLYISLTG
jgi:dephospho-CoA kinase